MKAENPNAPINRLKRQLKERWSSSDTPASEPRFQLSLVAKDIAIFLFLPLFAVFLFKMVESGLTGERKGRSAQTERKSDFKLDSAKSQIIDFSKGGSGSSVNSVAIYGKKAPGTLVRIRLLNLVETYSTAPVHAQIVDSALGSHLVGGTLLGEATPDTNFDRINIVFKFARDPNRQSIAVPINARALSLNGTLGLSANKKEGIVARSTLSAVNPTTEEIETKSDSLDLKNLIVKAFANGFMQELGKSATVENNRAQVLTLVPGSDFFAELTDYFPGAN